MTESMSFDMNDITRPRHCLSNLDAEAKTAHCSVCGPKSPVRIRINGKGECQTARRRNHHGSPEAHRASRALYRARKHVEISRERNGWVGDLDAEGYSVLLDAQGGGCAICGLRPTSRRLAIDHDHETGTVRGLLCVVCNTTLGRFKDDAARFERAARYLLER